MSARNASSPGGGSTAARASAPTDRSVRFSVDEPVYWDRAEENSRIGRSSVFQGPSPANARTRAGPASSIPRRRPGVPSPKRSSAARTAGVKRAAIAPPSSDGVPSGRPTMTRSGPATNTKGSKTEANVRSIVRTSSVDTS